MGRTILPKPVSLDEAPSVGYGNPQTSSNLLISTQNAPSSLPLSTSGICLTKEATTSTNNSEQEYPQSSSTTWKMVDSLDSVEDSHNISVTDTLPASSQPPPLIQLGDIDINSVTDAEDSAREPVPSGQLSPTPSTLASATHGVLKSPGPSGNTSFMNVEDVMTPSPSRAKGTQTLSSNFGGPPLAATNKPTMLTALLKNGSTQSQSAVPQGSAVVQQVLVSKLLNSLVNQNPIPTPSAFKKPAAAIASSKADPPTTHAPAVKVPPTVQCTPLQLPQSVSLPNPFNPSMFLAGPAQQQIVGTASTGAILTSSTLPPSVTLSPYLSSFPAVYGNGLVQVPTSNTSAAPRNVSGTFNKPSSPKKPRLA